MKKVIRCLLISVLSCTIGKAYAQSLTIGTSTVTTAGQTVTVPITAPQGLSDVGAISLQIGYSTTYLTFVGIENGPSGALANASGGNINIGWFSTTALNVASGGKLLDLKFTYNGGLSNGQSTPLAFVTSGCQISNSSGATITVTYDDGSVVIGVGTLPVLVVSSDSRDVAYTAGSTSFSVSNGTSGTTMNWTASVTNGSSWLTISSGSSGTNSGTINLSYTANAGSARSGTVTITASGATGSPKTLTVNQAPGPVGDIALTIGTSTVTTAGQTVTVPITAPQGLSDVGAISLQIGYSTTYLTFVGIENGPIGALANASGGNINIGWFSTTALNVASGGKLLDLKFTYNGGLSNGQSTPLAFVTSGCQISNSSGATITVGYYINGSVTQTAGDIPIVLTSKDTVNAGEEFYVDIVVGSASKPVSNLKVVSGTVTYTNTSVIDYVSYEIGSFFAGGQATVVPNDPAGTTDISVYQLSGSRSGTGTLLRLKYKILPTAQDGQEIAFDIVPLQANAEDGSAIAIVQTGKRIRVSSGVTVWPGDANNDGRVSIFDINSIVLNWGRTGPSRSDRTTNWSAKSASPWSPLSATYADCNGDGTINIFDINVIVLNFNQIHTRVIQADLGRMNKITNRESMLDTPLEISVPKYIGINQEFTVDIKVGSASQPIPNAKVVSFELFFTNTAIVDYVSCDAGSFMNGGQVQAVDEESLGKVSVSVFQITGSSSGFGTLVSMKFKTLSNARDGQAVAFTFGAIQANSSDGNLVLLSPTGATATVSATTSVSGEGDLPSEFGLTQNYPNPFNPSTTIDIVIPEAGNIDIALYDQAGTKVKQIANDYKGAGRYAVRLDCQELPSGVYYVDFRFHGMRAVRKITLLK